MREAIPYRTHNPATGSATSHQPPASVTGGKSVKELVLENAVIIFGRRGCCMCDVMKRLLIGHGVNPAVVEVDEAEHESEFGDELGRIGGGESGVCDFPVVFVGGKLLGGLEKVMGSHICGELVPILKDAGALWL